MSEEVSDGSDTAFSVDAFELDDRLRLFNFAAADKRTDYLWVLRGFEHARANFSLISAVETLHAIVTRVPAYRSLVGQARLGDLMHAPDNRSGLVGQPTRKKVGIRSRPQRQQLLRFTMFSACPVLQIQVRPAARSIFRRPTHSALATSNAIRTGPSTFNDLAIFNSSPGRDCRRRK
jgi:hypothetical protein